MMMVKILIMLEKMLKIIVIMVKTIMVTLMDMVSENGVEEKRNNEVLFVVLFNIFFIFATHFSCQGY